MADMFKYVRAHESQYPKLSVQYVDATCHAGGPYAAALNGHAKSITENIVFIPYVFITLGGNF